MDNNNFEQPEDRRNRLKNIVADIQQSSNNDIDIESEKDESGDEDEENEEFYTIGTSHLLNARKWIAEYSLPK